MTALGTMLISVTNGKIKEEAKEEIQTRSGCGLPFDKGSPFQVLCVLVISELMVQ